MDALRTGESTAQTAPRPARPAPAWEELKQEWETLLAGLEAASADPGDSTMQALAARWERLMALSTDGVSYAHDLAQCVDSLRSGGQPKGVPGGVPFERVGLALAYRVARSGSGRPFQR